MSVQFLTWTLLILALSFLILSFSIIRFAQKGAKPPLSKGRIAGEFFAGVAGSAIATVIPVCLLIKLPRDSTGGPAGTLTFPELFAFLSILVGYPIASAIGVYLVGNLGNQTGSSLLPMIIGGWLAGIGSFFGALLLVNYLSLRGWTIILPVLLGVPAVSMSAVATIIFNSARRYKSSTPQ